MNEEFKTNTVDDVKANCQEAVNFANDVTAKQQTPGIAQGTATIVAAIIAAVTAVVTAIVGAALAPIIAIKIAELPEIKRQHALLLLEKWKKAEGTKKEKLKEKLIKKYGINPEQPATVEVAE